MSTEDQANPRGEPTENFREAKLRELQQEREPTRQPDPAPQAEESSHDQDGQDDYDDQRQPEDQLSEAPEGETEDSEVNTGWLTFHSDGDIEIHENSDVILGMDNSAVNLKLVSEGMIEDRNGSNLNVKKHAELHGINIKLVKCGGLTPARRMISKAKHLGLDVMVGCMTESTVGISAIAQLLPLLDYVDMDKENVGPEERAALRGRRRSLSSILQS